MEEYEGPADLKKLQEINAIGEKWASVECDHLSAIPKVNQCHRIREICYQYAADIVKLQQKTESCQSYLDDSPYNTVRVNSYDMCMNDVEKSLKTLLDTYHDRLKQAEASQY